MVNNLGRKLTIIAVLLSISVGLLIFKDRPFRLGLDIRGGTRLSYFIDIDAAIRAGELSENENKALILQQTIDIISDRINSSGLKEPTIRQEGNSRVVIEIPGSAGLGGIQAEAALGAAMGPGDAGVLALTGDETQIESFPGNGGTVRIGSEKIHYKAIDGTNLIELTRAYLGTTAVAHESGATVELVSDNAIRSAIENLGELEFLILAEISDYSSLGTDATTERGKLEAWVAENPNLPLARFNRVPAEAGGPNPGIRWFPGKADGRSELERAEILLTSKDPWQFTGQNLGKVYFTQDRLGYPAVGFEFKPSKRTDFGDFTDENTGRVMAIVLNDVIASTARIKNRLPGGGIIEGEFSEQEVDSLVTVLRTGSLRIRPILEAEEIVGPSLGSDYVQRGFRGGIIALIAILLFMIGYYRKLGVFTAISLGANLLLLMGALAFKNATLTLPGIAGIILTVGMAVDANILIFDRIREEQDKGRNIKQAAKNGFDRALVTIVDANLTTLITGIILFVVGTGPLRGFAITLCYGVITSMFAALVITRVLVHYSLEKPKPSFSMGTWLVKADYKFLNKAKLALGVSSLAIIGGLGLFASMPDDEKMGIDFIGGIEMLVRTEEPQETDTLREIVGDIPGQIGQSATVKEVLQFGEGEGTYTGFRISFKTPGDVNTEAAEDDTDTLSPEIRAVLGDLLQKGPVELTLSSAGDTPTADLRLYFDEAHSGADIATQLELAGIKNAVVTEDPARAQTYIASGEAPFGTEANDLRNQILDVFGEGADSQGVAYTLSLPIPQTSVVGPQVVGELRDKALLAMLVSLFAIVMYIRVRFAEYSYGFAAVGALVHDVLITLGVLAVAIKTGLVQVEISLPMVAAFLTIIGYSLNDTIVLFDRIRENLPRVQKPLSDVLDLSINQTLSRTILTSVTTLLAVTILFAMNLGTGNVLEGFAFAMVIGILVGTYSSIFVASPLLLWFENMNKKRQKAEKAKAPAGAKKLAAKGA